MSLFSDIIAGYHGDDEETFNETMNLLEKSRPDIVNITRFSPRPFTRDFSSKVPPSEKIKAWTQEYSDKHREIIQSNMENHIGREKEIMITEKGKEGSSVGRDDAYRPVVVPGDIDLYRRIQCEIVDLGSTYLIGKII